MPRRPRLDHPGTPLHVTQRGVNRAATFAANADYRAYLDALRRASADYAVSVHAYVLMTNHVHLLVSAAERGAISAMMQAIGRRYVRGVNARHGRTGTLWEGRFKSCLVHGERYLLACYRYIELNPVRAGMVRRPEEYAWSSFRGNAGLGSDELLTPHASYLSLGSLERERFHAYRALVDDGLSTEDLQALRAHTQQERAWTSAELQAELSSKLGRSVVVRSQGRPRLAKIRA